MQKEINIEQASVKYARENGGMLIKQTSLIGLPDRLLICPGGSMVFIEFKDPKGKTSKIQDYMIKKLNNLGVPTFICKSREDFIKIYTYYSGGKNSD